MNARTANPVTIAVAVSLFVAASILAVGVAIGGSYALTLHAIHASQVAQQAGAVQECKSLHALDEAHDGISFPKVNETHPSEEALTKLFSGIHSVYENSGCQRILDGHSVP